MPLVYFPARRQLFLWGETQGPPAFEGLVGEAAELEVVVPPGVRRSVRGQAFELFPAAQALARAGPGEARSASVEAWSWAAKLGLELISRERIAPTLVRVPQERPAPMRKGAKGRGGAKPGVASDAPALEARWRVSLLRDEDAERVALLARSLPPAAHAVPDEGGEGGGAVMTPMALLRAFLDALADALVRAAAAQRGWRSRAAERAQAQSALPAGRSMGAAERARLTRALRRLGVDVGPSAERGSGRRGRPAGPAPVPWTERWLDALDGPDPAFIPDGFAERSLELELLRWIEPALGSADGPRLVLRLELPRGEGGAFLLRFLLQAQDDPSLIVEAATFWREKAHARAFELGLDALLRGLGRAAKLFAPLARALRVAQPGALELDADEAKTFLLEAAPALADAGISVQVPAELTRGGRQRLRLRLRLGSPSRGKRPAAVASAGLDLESLVAFRWRAVLGEEELDARELAELCRRKAGLVELRGRWVAIDPAELELAARHLAAESGQLSGAQALRLALLGAEVAELPVEVRSEGAFASALERLRGAARPEVPPPRGLRASLRPYQLRGLAWLVALDGLGLGACLADDMGLGKTLQAIAFLLERRARLPRERKPCLVVAPTSVVGNWERELSRFAPALAVHRHYGPQRLRSARELLAAKSALVVTSYGTLRLDAELLGGVEWSAVVLDEAQNIKNPLSSTARAARALRAGARLALTGTPVENRLSELWSILEFTNPGLLGSLESFRRRFALPIERYGDSRVAEELRGLVAPFVLRRLKRDPEVAPELPEKLELDAHCSLSREQASLYQAQCDSELAAIAQSSGIQRRGRVLALLTALKQICNHPAQYLGERGPLPGRSGKLERLGDLLEEVCLAGEQSLVFTQYRVMGELLVEHLSRRLGPVLTRGEVLFLHGGTPRAKREALVARFQDEASGPRVFVLSLKAGGTGLNLTAATHVFHFDRWWNPAVEDQASDRAHRIGQSRTVEVHRLSCAGTVEERVAELLERKRALAQSVVGAGESWISELGDDALRSLVALSADAAPALEEGEEEGSGERRESAQAKRRGGASRASASAEASGSPRVRRAGGGIEPERRERRGAR